MFEATYTVFSATINVTYTEGATCTCSNGDVTLTAADTTGFYAFTVGRTGTWTIQITKEGENEPKSTTVEITSNGQTEAVEITFIPIVPWSTGSDEDIAAMLQAHYEGKINIWDYWEIGQERVVHLNAISGGYDGIEDQPEQDTAWVLMHNGGFELTAGGTCAAVVGMKDCLNELGVLTGGEGHLATSWDDCQRRTWANSSLMGAMPEPFRNLFKQMNVVTANSIGSNTAETSVDYLSLPAEKEISGVNIYASSTAESTLFQFEWFKTAANRIKKSNGSAVYWFLRSPGSRSYWTNVTPTGEVYGNNTTVIPSAQKGLSFFGCI